MFLCKNCKGFLKQISSDSRSFVTECYLCNEQISVLNESYQVTSEILQSFVIRIKRNKKINEINQ